MRDSTPRLLKIFRRFRGTCGSLSLIDKYSIIIRLERGTSRKEGGMLDCGTDCCGGGQRFVAAVRRLVVRCGLRVIAVTSARGQVGLG
jgi:hypothetical protein